MQIFIFSFRNCTWSPLYWNVLRRLAARWLLCTCRALFCISNAITLCTARAWVGDLLTLSLDGGIGGLIPQSSRDLNRQASARVSQALRTSYLCHVIAVIMQLVMCLSFEHERVARQLHLHHSDCRTQWSTRTRLRAFSRIVTQA